MAAHKEFEVHMLNASGKEKAAAVSAIFDECLTALLRINPQPSREMSLTKTKLEEACFFAKKAMASDPANTE